MKLTCDSCSAKYSIADERVAGKLFKIRCKKCSHVIIVRGTAAPAVEVAPAPASVRGEWHAVVDGQQLGPFERDEVLRRRAAGTLDDETYVWREGMPDWAALGTLDELRAQPIAPPSVEVGEMTRLRNERNETSVLFTLGNLAQLASKPQPKPAAATASATGATAEEGSGLIDIRALASTWAQPAAHAKPATDDPLSVYAPIGLADPIVLVPTTSHGTDRRLLVALVAMLALVAALATVLVVVLTRDTGTTQAPATVPVTMPVPVKVEAAPAAAVAAAEVAVAEEPKIEPKTELKPDPKTEPRTESPPKRTRRPTPTPKALEPAATKQECTDVSCAYSNYAEKCCEPFKPKTAPKQSTATPGDLPENLDRAALAKGIATIKAQKCGASSSAKGDVHVSVKVTADGAVSSVTVKSSPDPALSACVVREAKQGSFARTRRGGSFAYFWRF